MSQAGLELTMHDPELLVLLPHLLTSGITGMSHHFQLISGWNSGQAHYQLSYSLSLFLRQGLTKWFRLARLD